MWLSANHADETIPLEGEVGTMAYYCDCNLIDSFGDRKWLDGTVQKQRQSTGVKALLYQFNFAFYQPTTPF